MKKIVITFLGVLIAMSFVFGQSEIVTTKDGKKVILNSDGTWKYEEVKKDTQKISSASDCSAYIQTTEDKMTGDKTTAAKKTIIVSNDKGKTGFGITLMLSYKGNLIFSIQTVGASRCIAKEAKINILFTDGSRTVLSNDGGFNCKGISVVYFGEYFDIDNNLAQLQSKKIATVRVWTSDSFVEQDFTEENSNDFFHVINCLTTK